LSASGHRGSRPRPQAGRGSAEGESNSRRRLVMIKALCSLAPLLKYLLARRAKQARGCGYLHGGEERNVRFVVWRWRGNFRFNDNNFFLFSWHQRASVSCRSTATHLNRAWLSQGASNLNRRGGVTQWGIRLRPTPTPTQRPTNNTNQTWRNCVTSWCCVGCAGAALSAAPPPPPFRGWCGAATPEREN
jgi:hypothetical protein